MIGFCWFNLDPHELKQIKKNKGRRTEPFSVSSSTSDLMHSNCTD